MTDADIADIIEGSRCWSVENVREYPEKAHLVINALADALERSMREATRD